MSRRRAARVGAPGPDPSRLVGQEPDASGVGERDRALALLRLLQLFDSQFPVGAFAQSGGLETYAAIGGGLTELRQIVHAQLDLGWGRSELAAACLAWRAADSTGMADAIAGLARTLDALKVVPAAREMSIGLGRRTLGLIVRLYPDVAFDIARPHHALIVGVAARRLGVEARDLLIAFAQSLAMGTLAAAVRCMPVSPTQAQELLVDAHPQIIRSVERALADPEASLFTCTPALDIRSRQQASLHTRLFQS